MVKPEAEISDDVEALIHAKHEEFRNVVQEHSKLYPDGTLGIACGEDPIAREAMTRLMEEQIEQALALHAGHGLEPDELQRLQAEVREQVRALFARNTTYLVGDVICL